MSDSISTFQTRARSTETDREEFVTGSDVNGKRALDVSILTGNGLLSGISWDAYQLDNTSSTTEDVYTFYSGGPGGTLVATLTLTYATTDKTLDPIQGVIVTP